MEVFHMVSNSPLMSSASNIHDAFDDLKRIKGIGAGVETRLNQAGVLSFDQLAATSPEQISDMLADMIGMSPQKIEDQDWIGQAKQFSTEAEADEAMKIPASSTDQQHYETFSVKLLVDDDKQVRRTNIIHVQKGEEENWAGWDEQRLIAFVVEHAALTVTTSNTTLQMNVESLPATQADILSSPTEITHFNIDTVDVREVGNGGTSNIIATDQDWSIQLKWTLPDNELISGNWQVKAYLESMGPGNGVDDNEYAFPGISLPIISNKNSYSGELNFNARDIAPGIYWLVVTITSENAMKRQSGKLVPVYLTGFAEKSMLQFYKRQ
jgi:hypothetical protein